ncbi:MAG: hypothetical protein KC613_04405 [Myxococcales bacterium]|nr:hypothetical protein [Myxococcales bacterium]MCB9522040.1 hypothetical protein [Myxococcales bacterium]
MAEATDSGLRTIPLIDPETGDELMTSVAAEFEYEGQTFLVVTPVDEVVSIIRIEGTEEEESLQELEIEEFPAVASAVNEAMKQWNLKVEPRGNELVLVGDIPEDLFEDCDELEVETDDGEDRTLLILMEIDTGDTTYLVAANMGYILYPALDEGESARPLTTDELASMQAVFDEVYREMDKAAEED